MHEKPSLWVFVVAIAAAGCFGTEVPPDKPAESPLSGTTPGAPKEDVTKREDKAHERVPAKFDRQQTQVSINRGARQAAECAKIHTTGPFGDVTIKLTIDNVGKIADAVIPAPFDGTPMGKCVEQAFEHEYIPPWDGPDEVMEATVTLKKPDAAPPPDDPKKKKK